MKKFILGLMVLMLLGLVFVNASTSDTDDSDVFNNELNLYRGESTSLILNYKNTNNFSITNISFELTNLSYENLSEAVTLNYASSGVIAPNQTIQLGLGIDIPQYFTPNTDYSFDILVTYDQDSSVPDHSDFDRGAYSEIFKHFVVHVKNHVPVIDSVDGLAEQYVIGQSYLITILASDADNDVLTYSLSNQPAGMSVNSTTGIISFTPQSVGTNNVSFIVSDSFNSSTQYVVFNVVESGKHLVVPEISLGSEDQERDRVITKTFTLSNTGSESVTNLVVESDVASDYNLTYELSKTNIAPNEAVTLTLRLYIPLDQDSGSVDLGTLTFKDDTAVLVQKDIVLTTESYLSFRTLKYRVNDGSRKSLDESDTIDVNPDDKISFYVVIKNENDDYDFEDGLTLNLNCDDLDVDEDYDYDDDLNHNKRTDEIEFEISIPYDEDEDSYSCVLSVKGKDENHATHELLRNFDINLDKESHKIKIDSFKVDSLNVLQGGYITLSLDMVNIGSHDEDEVYVMVSNDALNIHSKFGPYELDEAEDTTKTITVNIPSDVDPGNYEFTLITFYRTSHVSDTETFTVHVESANPVNPTPTPTPQPEPIIINPVPNNNNSVHYVAPVNTRSDNTLLILLGVLVIVLIGIIVILLIPRKR